MKVGSTLCRKFRSVDFTPQLDVIRLNSMSHWSHSSRWRLLNLKKFIAFFFNSSHLVRSRRFHDSFKIHQLVFVSFKNHWASANPTHSLLSKKLKITHFLDLMSFKVPLLLFPISCFSKSLTSRLSFSICLSKHSLAHFPDLLFGSIQDHSHFLDLTLLLFGYEPYGLHLHCSFSFNCFNPLTSLGQTHFLTICSRNWLGAVLQT